MSVVAVKITENEITIGADSIIVSGWTQEKDKLAKLIQVNDLVIGDVGSAQEGALFFLFCKTRKPREASTDAIIEFMSDFQDWLDKKIGENKIGNQYIIVFNKKVFNVEGFYVKEVVDYSAIGAGMDFAITCLALGHSVEKAIEMSCHFSIYCELPANIITINK